MKRTAMQQHIEWLKDTLEIAEENKLIIANILRLCLKDAEQKLSIDKDQMIEFAIDYVHQDCSAETLYNKTFNKE